MFNDFVQQLVFLLIIYQFLKS